MVDAHLVGSELLPLMCDTPYVKMFFDAERQAALKDTDLHLR